MNFEVGMVVYLKKPYLGYKAVRLLKREPYKWLVEIIPSGLEVEFYEDEFDFEWKLFLTLRVRLIGRTRFNCYIMEILKVDKKEFLKGRSHIKADNLPKYARFVGVDEIVVLYYDLEGFENDRQKYANMGFNFAEIHWIENNIAPPIDPEYLNQEVAYFDDEVNTFCIKTNSAAICFCTNSGECSSFAQCFQANKTLKELKIKAF